MYKNIIQRQRTTSVKAKYLYMDNRSNCPLTKREAECFLYILQALSAKEIARKMNITKKTAEQYIAVLKEKVGCRTKSELIVKAVKDRMADTILSWFKEK